MAVPLLFALALFTGSSLVFLVQPMCAKMVLPLLGGTPAVWNTCMVFFQAGLLAGYAYAHAAPARLGPRLHAPVHLALFLLPLWLLPIAISTDRPVPEGFPAFWLLGLLFLSAGFPFVMASSTAPLLQRWFALTGHPRAHDPYFLYAASNLGSMLALISYPVLVEPNLTLPQQSLLWTWGYALLALFTAACAGVMWWKGNQQSVVSGQWSVVNQNKKQLATDNGPRTTDKGHHSPLTTHHSPLTRLRWLLLALVPSSLMLSVTTHVSTDLAAIPLFWVVPLGLYLLTFILVFAGKPLLPHSLFIRWMPLIVLLLVLTRLMEAGEPVALLVGLHLVGLFWIAMVCHGELAKSRPAPEQLTGFYLWLALGGVLGGMFNALLAPLLFNSLVEYPLMLVLACLLRPGSVGKTPAPDAGRAEDRSRLVLPRSPKALLRGLLPDLLPPLLVGFLTVILILIGKQWRLPPGAASVAVMFSLPIFFWYTFLHHPLRLGLGLGALLLASTLYSGVHGRADFRLRSFFGVYLVTRDPGREYRYLVHGNTIHGIQSLDPERENQPLSYFYRDPEGKRSSPIGQLFAALKGDLRLGRVAVIGLGAGAMACYAGPGQEWTFLEIDPAVIQIARRRFTYLDVCRGQVEVLAGDGRLSLAKSRGRFGLIAVDAFSSDAIPLHLLTREAFEVYRSHLTERGVLAFHISNRYLDLEPVLANLARDADPPFACWIQRDLVVHKEEKADGKQPSVWVVLANRPQDVKSLFSQGSWIPAQANPNMAVWTDRFSNLLDVFKWEREILEE